MCTGQPTEELYDVDDRGARRAAETIGRGSRTLDESLNEYDDRTGRGKIEKAAWCPRPGRARRRELGRTPDSDLGFGFCSTAPAVIRSSPWTVPCRSRVSSTTVTSLPASPGA